MVFVKNQWPNQVRPCDSCGQPRSRQNKTGLCKECFWKSVANDKHWRWKGEAATDQAIHERTRKLYPGPHNCNRCGKPAEQLHHIDRDHFNNDPANIEPLCRSCHTKETKPWLSSPIIKRGASNRMCAKVIRYGDFTGVETDFKQAPVGMYYLKCEDIEQKPSKNGDQMVEVIFKPVKDANGAKLKENYGRLWYYAPLDPDASWARRMKDLVTAFGLKPSGGNLGGIVGKECLGRLKEDTDLDGEYRPNIGKLINPKGASIKPVVDDEDEDEDEESNGALDAMNRTALKQLIKSEALEIKVLKTMSDDDLRAAISEVWPAEEEDEEEELDEEEDEEEEDEEPEDNYDSMTVKALRQECEDRELETKGGKAVLIARLRTDDQEEPV